MKQRELLQVDPAKLHLPGSRREGADPKKLQRQIAKFGDSLEGMPPPEVKRGDDGELVIFDGVTRASRAAKFAPGTHITVEVTGELRGPGGRVANRRRKTVSRSQQIRRELLAALEELSTLCPDWRLGQTLANLATTAGRMDAGGVWDLEDVEALAAAKKLIADVRNRVPGNTPSIAQS